MAQRAILGGDTNVQASTANDDIWAGLTAASHANQLKLPCCGAMAIPKANEHGTRWFAHGPYRRIACDWKTTDARHETVIQAICAVALDHGWIVETESRGTSGQAWKADVLCSREKSQVKMAFQVELLPRPSEEILAEDAAFDAVEIISAWMFLHGSRHSRPPVRRAVTIGATANLAGEAAAQAIREFDRISRAITNARDMVRHLRDLGWDATPVFERHIPVAVSAVRQSDGHRILLRTETRIEIDVLGAEDENRHWKAELQRELAQALRQRLDHGIELWWPGFPQLEADTFDRLKAEMRQHNECARSHGKAVAQETMPRRPVLSAEPPQTLANFPVKKTEWVTIPPKGPDPELIAAARRGETAPCPTLNEWGERRVAQIRKVAAYLMPLADVDNWMNTRNEVLGGLTPNQLAASKSNALERCEVALGIREPETLEWTDHRPPFAY